MSHELRTPMNAILGFSQLMHLDETLNIEHKSSVHEIMLAGNHLLLLINDLLDLAKIEAGKIDLNFEDYSLNDILKSSLSLINPLSIDKNIPVIDIITPTSNYMIHVDPTRFKQVIINLLSNAIKYNRKNSKVTLSCVPADNKFIRINIIDEGEGISEEDIQKLFTSFERVGKKSGIEGTGIGLVISRNLIELMGGEIGVESKIGIGCCFWVKVPLA